RRGRRRHRHRHSLPVGGASGTGRGAGRAPRGAGQARPPVHAGRPATAGVGVASRVRVDGDLGERRRVPPRPGVTGRGGRTGRGQNSLSTRTRTLTSVFVPLRLLAHTW